MRSKAAGFFRDHRGVAAVEFAFIAPILLVMYFITMEASQAIETSKKVSRVASMVADLVTQQQQSTSKTAVEAIMKIGDSILQPYNRSSPTIIVTAIQLDDRTPPNATVAWSRKMVAGATSNGPAVGSSVTIPEALRIGNSFLIRVESSLGYKPVITWSADQSATLGLTSAFNSIQMGETYYLRPRMSQAITCDDCKT
jgi:Flp pilus assembly protein TadG